MKLHDLSLPVSPDMIVWPGAPSVGMRRVLDQERGDVATSTELSLNVHTGTHLDAPLHFVRDGTGVESLSLDVLCGPTMVYHELEAEALTADVFEKLNIPDGTERLLVRTRNSDLWAKGVREFTMDYVAVSAEGAHWLVDRRIKLIGVDYLSVAPYPDPITPHDILLRAGVIAVEGLNLSGIASGLYTLYCLPLKLVNADGAPARVVLVENA